jgi:hypothetical protein
MLTHTQHRQPARCTTHSLTHPRHHLTDKQRTQNGSTRNNFGKSMTTIEIRYGHFVGHSDFSIFSHEFETRCSKRLVCFFGRLLVKMKSRISNRGSRGANVRERHSGNTPHATPHHRQPIVSCCFRRDSHSSQPPILLSK